ncbi:MAG: hypothetical protein FJ147_10620 [Deltaproteobacteria bacterium]|nr:hypothetical protein [Deltaproteobacteria bacterium]
MFEPDVLLPEQVRALQGKRLTSEQRLLYAVLEEAVHSFRTYVWAGRPREKQIFRDAEEWFESADTSWFFSFINVCDALGLDPDYVRRAMRNWKAAQLQSRAQLKVPHVDTHLNRHLPHI